MLEYGKLTREEIEYIEVLIDFAQEAHEDQLKNGKKYAEENPAIHLSRIILSAAQKSDGEQSLAAKTKEKELNDMIERVEMQKNEKAKEGIRIGNDIRTKLSVLKNEVIQ